MLNVSSWLAYKSQFQGPKSTHFSPCPAGPFSVWSLSWPLSLSLRLSGRTPMRRRWIVSDFPVFIFRIGHCLQRLWIIFRIRANLKSSKSIKTLHLHMNTITSIHSMTERERHAQNKVRNITVGQRLMIRTLDRIESSSQGSGFFDWTFPDSTVQCCVV